MVHDKLSMPIYGPIPICIPASLTGLSGLLKRKEEREREDMKVREDWGEGFRYKIIKK